jgi:hypothetical protein
MQPNFSRELLDSSTKDTDERHRLLQLANKTIEALQAPPASRHPLSSETWPSHCSVAQADRLADAAELERRNSVVKYVSSPPAVAHHQQCPSEHD